MDSLMQMWDWAALIHLLNSPDPSADVINKAVTASLH
jgi:hypothetical protein